MDIEKNKEALAIVRQMVADGQISQEVAEKYFPELKESEDERIRKDMIETIKKEAKDFPSSVIAEKSHTWLAWLEKQGEQKTVDEIAKEVCKNKESATIFLKSAGIMNEKGELAEQYRQGEQKTTDKVKPKFKVGDTVKDPYGDLYHITEIKDDSYKTDDGRFILFENQEVYTLSNFTAWSEEDDEMLDSIIEEVRYIGEFPDYPTKEENELYDECLTKVEWLKSLKDRHTWKPSDEQMKALRVAIGDEQGSDCCCELRSLLKDLKSL